MHSSTFPSGSKLQLGKAGDHLCVFVVDYLNSCLVVEWFEVEFISDLIVEIDEDKDLGMRVEVVFFIGGRRLALWEGEC